MLDREFGDAGRMPDFREIAADDQFLTEISNNNSDASGAGAFGTDAHLAELFTDARGQLNDLNIDHSTIDDIMAQLDAEEGVSATEPPRLKQTAEPSDDTVVMGPASWWKPSRISSAVLGAAASMAIFAGGFGAIQAAEPDSALWGVRVALFGEKTASVELASMLDEIDAASSSGDTQRAEELLSQAEDLMNQVGDAERSLLEERLRESTENVAEGTIATETIIQERTVENPGQPVTVIITETVVERETATYVQTETVTKPASENSSSSLESETPKPSTEADSGSAEPRP
ncbi:hypothetical protein [Corynebacterium sp. H113]|uniref:hypothetical protein n=1 Tax=Corynebacterium sp. H113 TaxID=3133419 RepID=UPI0030AAD1EB